MSFAVGYSLDEAQLLLTLAASAYVDEKPLPKEPAQAQASRMRKDIDMSLAQSAYSGWQVAWGPGLTSDRGNMMYVAGNQTTNQYAVSIRGTDWSFLVDWIEDLASLLPLVPFTTVVPAAATGIQGIKIAAGTQYGLEELIGMTDSASGGAPQPDVITFLKGLPPGASIFVTGHSLGACLASIMAARLAYELGGSGSLKVYTFAAPTAGNGAFADYYNRLFTDAASGVSTAYRIYNTLDAVPNGWATLPTITTYYAPSPHCPEDVTLIIDEAVKFVGTEYVQVGTSVAGSVVPLTGHVIAWDTWIGNLDPTGNVEFAHQVAEQHATSTYASLLSAAPTVAASLKVRSLASRVRARRAALVGS
jgi:hypothetical protein